MLPEISSNEEQLVRLFDCPSSPEKISYSFGLSMTAFVQGTFDYCHPRSNQLLVTDIEASRN